MVAITGSPAGLVSATTSLPATLAAVTSHRRRRLWIGLTAASGSYITGRLRGTRAEYHSRRRQLRLTGCSSGFKPGLCRRSGQLRSLARAAFLRTGTVFPAGDGQYVIFKNFNDVTFVVDKAPLDVRPGGAMPAVTTSPAQPPGSPSAPISPQPPAAYSITGATAALKLGLTANPGSYTLTGSPAALRLGLAAAAGSYTVTGTAAGLTATANFVLPAAAGAYTLTGSPAGLVSANNVVLSAVAGSYTLTGQDVGFNVGNNIVLAASTGSYTITGSPAGLVAAVNVVLPAAAGRLHDHRYSGSAQARTHQQRRQLYAYRLASNVRHHQ